MPRYVCVHGHFYQPPRENPWLEAIEPQPSAAPYHDWNARITAECYRPNARARIVDGAGRITGIVDNYARMSFNVGPTLLDYLAREAPDVHAALVAADRASAARFGGHGSAMAQAYGHLIMPLASPRDRRTQVAWGVADFKARFGRMPEGMWLPECAVDVDSLEALAEAGIRFTVLAPHQAARWRPRGGTGPWHDRRGGDIDPTRVYRCDLPSGRAIDLFFYDGPTSRAVAFERLLVDGGRFADRLCAGGGGLAHIATDGESYGHHHRFGDMALAWALERIDRGAGHGGPRLTNYGQFRTLEPATWQVEIVERSSWSCAHGIERWRSDCGCNGGAGVGWNQAWRGPLRAALDWLRDELAAGFVAEGAALWHDPWAARDAYIDVVLARDADHLEAWLAAHARPELTAAQVQRARELVEAQRHAMAMYTSCGWFFDDLAGIETVQCLAYAARAIDLAGRGLEAGFVERLAAGRSNVGSEGDGRQIWERRVRPSRRAAADVVAHVAVQALLEAAAPEPDVRVLSWELATVERLERRDAAGDVTLVAARVLATSLMTGAQVEVAHVGRRDRRAPAHLAGSVVTAPTPAAWAALVARLGAGGAPLDADALAAALPALGAGRPLELGALIGAARGAAVEALAASAVASLHQTLDAAYQARQPLLALLHAEGLPLPAPLLELATAALRHRVYAIVTAATPDVALLDEVRRDARALGVELETPALVLAAGAALRELVARVALAPDDADALTAAASAATLASRLQGRVERWHAQNTAWELRARHRARWATAAARGDAGAAQHLASLDELCAALGLAPA